MLTREDACSRDVDHGIGEVEGCVGGEDGGSKLRNRKYRSSRMGTSDKAYSVTSNKLHNARDELAYTSKEQQDTDEHIWSLDTTSVDTEN